MEKESKQGTIKHNHEGKPKVMKEHPESITFEMPINAVESFFNALSILRPSMLEKTEFRAIQLFKEQILMELELYMETPKEKEIRQKKFQQMFNEIREEKKRIEPKTESYNV
mgnify:CR=1 FL=1